MKKLIIPIVAACVSLSAAAKVVLPSVLGSNMVLQQQSEANLWGKADPDKKVTISVSATRMEIGL